MCIFFVQLKRSLLSIQEMTREKNQKPRCEVFVSRVSTSDCSVRTAAMSCGEKQGRLWHTFSLAVDS